LRKASIAAWPNNARIAVMVTILYESWSDGEVPSHSPMVLAAPMRPGTPDLQGIIWSEYGGETGVWRLLEILERHRIASTFCTTASSVERYPGSIAAIHSAGHELAAHSYTQDMLLPYFTRDEEAELIRRCTDIIGGAVGIRPAGWVSPRATATRHTADLLIDAGYRWHGDYNDSDLPYIIRRTHGDIVALAHSDFTDIRAIRGSPRDFLHVHCDMMDFLRKSGRPEIINLSIHAHFGGRPMMAALFDQILGYYSSFDDVWFARHDELADWVRREKISVAPPPADAMRQSAHG
jgi:peptidoglycan/xylan/chitin deacetylase (PgdA/CDA1 family)